MAVKDPEHLRFRRLCLAARAMIDDLADTEEDCNPESGEEYATTRELREAIEEIERDIPWIMTFGG